MKTVAGFQHAYVLGNREAGRTLGVGWWEPTPDEAAMQNLLREAAEPMSQVAPGRPMCETFEVLVRTE